MVYMAFKEISLEDFLTKELATDKTFKPSTKTTKFSILIGNGLLNSHPELGSEFNISAISIKNDFISDLESLHKYKDFSPPSPEGLFRIYKNIFIIEVLQFYLSKIKLHSEKLIPNRIDKFCKLFKDVYTINYDPVFYSSLLTCCNDSRFLDGFTGDNAIETTKIIDRMNDTKYEGKTPVFYLHGSYFILENTYEHHNHKIEYKKIISSSKNASCNHLLDYMEMKARKKHFKILADKIQDYYDRLKRDYLNHSDLDDFSPTALFESDWYFKKATIRHDTYTTFCLDMFSKIENVVLFGCSFEKDEHLLEALALNSGLKEVYIFYKNKEYLYSRMIDGINELIKIRKIHKPITDKSKIEIYNLETFKDNLYNKATWINTSKIGELLWKQ
jgi:hypothetical protein